MCKLRIRSIINSASALVWLAMPRRNRSPVRDVYVKLFWRALKTIDEDYTVFVHLVDANGKIIAQKDDQPQRGAYPTSFWDAGEVIGDEHALTIPRDALSGTYQVEVGIYRVSDGARLPVRDGDHIVLTNLQIDKLK